jgi:hypothetical protein
VRTLPDLNIALLEVVRARRVEEGDRSTGAVVDYRLKEVILGHPEGPWTGMRQAGYPLAVSSAAQMASPVLRALPQVGQRFLYLSGASFDSCQIVPAAPSAESAVRGAVPADRRIEDEVAIGGRM